LRKRWGDLALQRREFEEHKLRLLDLWKSFVASTLTSPPLPTDFFFPLPPTPSLINNKAIISLFYKNVKKSSFLFY